jgi:hypothetical protein
MSLTRLVPLLLSALVLAACGEETPVQQTTVSAAQNTVTAPASDSTQTAPANPSGGGVTVEILPENPTSSGCLKVVIHGTPGRSAVIWKVNDTVVANDIDSQLCSDNYKRSDNVSVEVGTSDKGAQASVVIGNSPPRVVDIFAEPAEVFAGADISVTPVAEDADGDSVTFTYQWLINDDADPSLTDATLLGNRFTKGDRIKVLIVPSDFYANGPTYESYATQVLNAAPQITSQPPEGISSLDYRYQVAVNDPDDSQFSYRLKDAPAGMSIDAASGLIKWSLVGVAPGDYTITIIVNDPTGAEAAQAYTLTLGTAQ